MDAVAEAITVRTTEAIAVKTTEAMSQKEDREEEVPLATEHNIDDVPGHTLWGINMAFEIVVASMDSFPEETRRDVDTAASSAFWCCLYLALARARS